MWVELVGLPGVGKTTLIENNIPEIVKNYRIVKSDSNSVLQKIICRLLLLGFYSWKLADHNLAKKLAYRHSFRFLRNRKTNTFFYDSGISQVIIENLIETNFSDKDEKISILMQIQPADKIIFLNDEIENIAHREVHRQKRRFKLDLPEIITRYKKAQFLIENEILNKCDLSATLNIAKNDDFIKALNK